MTARYIPGAPSGQNCEIVREFNGARRLIPLADPYCHRRTERRSVEQLRCGEQANVLLSTELWKTLCETSPTIILTIVNSNT